MDLREELLYARARRDKDMGARATRNGAGAHHDAQRHAAVGAGGGARGERAAVVPLSVVGAIVCFSARRVGRVHARVCGGVHGVAVAPAGARRQALLPAVSRAVLPAVSRAVLIGVSRQWGLRPGGIGRHVRDESGDAPAPQWGEAVSHLIGKGHVRGRCRSIPGESRGWLL